MALNSFYFWIFFPFVFLFYWAIPSQKPTIKKWFLVIVSYGIYMSFFVWHALVLMYVTAVTFCGARTIERQETKRKTCLWLFLAAAFAPLFFFKYLNFFVTSSASIFHWIGMDFEPEGLNWAIPIGISFFSVQAVAYMVEVYYRKTIAEKSFSDYILFLSFFPHIICGPISLSSELLPQIKNPKPFNYSLAVSGMKRVVWGMFLKFAIADRAGLFVDHVYKHFDRFTGSDCFLTSIVYSIQIYADFAGYSMIAIGVANLLGYRLAENFRRPYFAVTVGDFWRRWHLTLSRWLKYNIYIPLKGSRCSKPRNYFNLLATFTVSGLWHGANWTFVFWGLTHGVSIVVEKMLKIHKFDHISLPMRLLRIFITFNIVNFSRFFFRMPTLSEAFDLIGHTFSDLTAPLTQLSEPSLIYFLMMLPILVVVDVYQEFFEGKIRFVSNKYVQWSAYVLLVLLVLFMGRLSGGEFIYAQF